MQTGIPDYDRWYVEQAPYIQVSWAQIIDAVLCRLRTGVTATDLAGIRWSVAVDFVTLTKSPDPIKYAIAYAAVEGEEFHDNRGEFPQATWKKLLWDIRVSHMEGCAVGELYERHYTSWRYFEELWFLDPIKYSYLHDGMQLENPSDSQLLEITHYWASAIMTRVDYVSFPDRAYDQWLTAKLRQPGAISRLQEKLLEFLA